MRMSSGVPTAQYSNSNVAVKMAPIFFKDYTEAVRGGKVLFEYQMSIGGEFECFAYQNF